MNKHPNIGLACSVLLLFNIFILAESGRGERYRGPGNPSGLQRHGQNSWRVQAQNEDPESEGYEQSPGFFGSNNNPYESDQDVVDEDADGIQQSVNHDPEDLAGIIAAQQKQTQKPIEGRPSSAGITTPRPRPSPAKPVKYQSGEPRVSTDAGNFHGKLLTTPSGKNVYAFYGIPYAKPPLGELKFKRPVPVDTIDGVFEATELPNACFQENIEIFPGFSGEQMWMSKTNISEDCLYLNIWVPEDVFIKKGSELVPVLFWIHGGGFFSGGSSLDVYNGAVLALQEEVIVVSVQYRLGYQGFIYLGTEDAPGNVGLWDQNLALKWVNKNIRDFGGDLDLITLFGESAGAASVGLHLLSPASKAYFKRAVLMSGIPGSEYSFVHPNVLKQRSYKVAKLAGCDTRTTPQQIASCLREVDPEVLTRLQWRFYKKMLAFPFVPTIDGKFIPDHPTTMLSSGDAKRSEILMGTVADEGSYFVLYHYLKYFHHDKATKVTKDRFEDIMRELFAEYSELEQDAIINYYTNWENPEDGYQNQKRISEAVGDALFICPLRQFADSWSNRGLKVYFYHLTQRSQAQPWADWMGVMHGDDIPYFLGLPVNDTKSYSAEDQELSLKIMKLLANFAKLGTPSENWERYTSETPVYLDLNASHVSDETVETNFGPRPNHCALWNKLLPTMKRLSNKGQGNRRRPQRNGRNQQQQQPFDQYIVSQDNSWRDRGIHGGQGFHEDTLDHDHAETMEDSSQPDSTTGEFCQPQPTPNYCQQYPNQRGNPPVAQAVHKPFGNNKPRRTHPRPQNTCNSCCNESQNDNEIDDFTTTTTRTPV